MRIGLFGGTFNPIHFGHLRSCLEVQEAFELDRIYLIPSAIPPHKAPQDVVNAEDRYRMIQLAIAGKADFVVSDVEHHRPGPSYSIDTVCHLQALFPEDTRFFLILGSDAFHEIGTWKAYDEFFDRLPFIIMMRPGKWSPETPSGLNGLDTLIKTKISERYVYSADRSGFVHDTKKSIFIAQVTGLDISSTHIRGLIRRKKSIQYMVPDAVANYIESKGLYL